MSVFSLKIDIADNKFFNGETSPLFSQSQAKLARQFHQKIAGYRPTPLCALDDRKPFWCEENSSSKTNQNDSV